MVLGEARQSPIARDSFSDCLSASFHRGVKNLILLAFNKEVLLVDVNLSQALGTIHLDRIHSGLASLTTCSERDDIYVLHDSGSVSIWKKKSNLTVAATPSMTRSTSIVGLGKTQNRFELAGSDVLLEISYISKVSSI